MIDIELIVNGQNIIPNVYDSAQLQDNLEHSGGLSLSWKSKTDGEIPTGSYVEYQGMRYVLLNPYAPSKEGGPKNTRASYYKYDPTFKHPQALLDKTPLWFTARDANNQPIELRTTSYTGFPYIIVEQVVNFMAVYANKMADHFFAETVGLELTDPTQEWDATNNPYISTWAVNIPPVIVDQQSLSVDAHTIITVGFDGASIKGAIDSIADAMGCNVYWDWSYTDYEDDDHNITKKRTIRFVAGTTIDGESFNCFHVLGGTTNMGKATVSGGFAAVTQRLTLDTTQYPGSIIDMRPNHSGIRLTKELILDNIYPKMELYIKTATARTCYLTDEEGNFIVDHYDVGYDKPVLKTFAKWYVELALDKAGTQPYQFDQSLLIDDKPLSMLFQLDYRDPSSMSKLVGRQFELTYFPEVTKEWDKTDAMVDADGRYTGDTLPYNQGYNAPAGSFRVAFVAEGEIILPTTSAGGLCPQVGDKVTLVNMNLSDEVGRAKTELLAAAREIISLMQTPKGEYSETVIFGDPDQTTHQVPAPRIPRLMVGDATPFGNEHGPIVSAISLNLDTDVAEVTVSSWTRKTRSGGTADKVETVTVSANSSTNGSDNYSNGSIGDGNYGGGSDTQITYSNATPKADSLFLASLNNIVDAVACDASGKVKLDTDVITKITCNYGTKDITSVCNLSYTEDWPYTGTVGDLKAVTAFLQNEDASVSTQLTVPNRTYDLSETKRYIRIHFPQGFDMAHFDAKLLFPFVIGHPYFTDRDVSLAVEALIPGEAGLGGPFKSRAFARSNADLSGVTVQGGSYSDPLPYPRTQTYTIGGQQVQVTWSDGIPQGTAKLWSTVRTFYLDNTASSWSAPSQETDTDTLDIEFSLSTTQPSAPTGETPHSDHSSEGWYDPTLNQTLPSGKTWSDMIWRAERKISNGVYDGNWTITRIKGEKGDNGGNTANVMLYKKAAHNSSLTVPQRTLYYKFGDDTRRYLYTDASCQTPATSTDLDGWSLTVPLTTMSEIVYVTSAIAFNTTGADEIGSGEWATPVQFTDSSINCATIFLYKRKDGDAPTDKPNVSLFYKFADGKLYTTSALTTEATTQLRGWSRQIPTYEANKPCYVIQASALSNIEYDEIEASNWSDVTKLVEDGKSIIKQSEVYSYGVNESSTTPPTDDGNESQDAQLNKWYSTRAKVSSLWTADRYLWTKTYITWSDNSHTTLYSADRNPNDGVAGMDIVAGSTTIQYQLTDTNVQPTSGWGSYPSVLTPGKYLWSKATTPYYKGSVGGASAGESVTYNVSYIAQNGTNGTNGRDGTNGTNGRGIKSITEYYLADASDSPKLKPSSASGWTTDPNVPSPYGPWGESKRYLWNMEETVYTNSDGSETTDYTIPQILAIWTKDGANGAAGKGIDSIQNYYKITNSLTPPSRPSTDPTGGGDVDGWYATPIAPNADNPYLYNYEAITWLNPSSTTHTSVQMIGHYGTDGISVEARYSPDSSGSVIHTTFQTGDKYMSTRTTGGTWSDWQKIVGENGADGENGSYTDFSFGISSQKTTDDAQTPPTDISSWSDAPISTTTQKPYLWAKVVEIDGDGHEVSGTTRYIRLNGEDGTSPWVADLDNEMDSVACDAAGEVLDGQSVTTNVSLWHGSSKESCTIRVFNNDTGVEYNNHWDYGQFEINWENSTGEISIEYNGHGSGVVPEKQVFHILLTNTANSITRDLYFTVNGVKPGANGQPATIYSLQPSVSSIKCDKNNTLTPTQFTCSVQKVSGSTPSTATSTDGTLRYRIDGDIASVSDGYSLSIGGTINNYTSSNKYIVLAFFDANNTLRDKERIQIVADGTDGAKGDKGDKGDNGDNGFDAVTYEIVFTEAWARKDNNGEVRGRLSGHAYKIEGATRTALANTTIRMGYTDDSSTTKTTDSNGYFSSLNGTSDWFIDDWEDTNYAKSIYASIIINNTPVCTEYINISFDGSQGPRGATGRMYFMQGKWNANTTYTRTTERIPLVFHSNGNDWNTALECYGHYYYLNANSATGSDVPGVSSKWALCDEFAIVISRGIFAEFAKLGGFVISGDWMISQTAVSGSPEGAYNAFNPDYPNSAAPNNNNFIPVYAVDGRTGKVYMNDAEVAGTINASTIKGTVVVGDNSKAYMEIVPTTEGTEGSGQVYRADILGKSAGIPGDALDIGVYRLKNSSVMGSHITLREATTGNTVYGIAHVSPNEISVADGIGNNAHETSIRPLGINTEDIVADTVYSETEVTTKKVKGVDSEPVAFPSNIITSDRVELDNNLPAGAVVFAPNCEYVKSSKDNVYASRNDDGILNNLTTNNGHKFGNKASRIFVKYSTEYWKEFDCQGP